MFEPSKLLNIQQEIATLDIPAFRVCETKWPASNLFSTVKYSVYLEQVIHQQSTIPRKKLSNSWVILSGFLAIQKTWSQYYHSTQKLVRKVQKIFENTMGDCWKKRKIDGTEWYGSARTGMDYSKYLVSVTWTKAWQLEISWGWRRQNSQNPYYHSHLYKI